MKVLYIGCYRDGTGWAYAAQGYILSLDSVGIEVVPRFIKLNNNNYPIPERIEELEQNSEKNCGYVIQHVLPHQLDFNGEFEKNIALYVTETDNCRKSSWPERINTMDEAWVPNVFMAKEVSKNSNIFIPHYVIPHAANMENYQREYEPLEIPEIKNKFVFYCIGEINRRKNIGMLMKSFHLEFSRDEDVCLMIKAHIPGESAEQAKAHLTELSSKVKRGLKIYPSEDLYHREIFICDYLSDEQIMRLHSTGDCFVSASFGESWGIPIFDAMAMGKTPICTNTGGPRDFIDNGGYLVDSTPEPCFGMIETFEELYSGKENWDNPSVQEMRKHMRAAFNNKKEREEKSRCGIEDSYKYSYNEVGIMMKEALRGQAQPFNNSNTAKKQNSILRLNQ